MKVMLLNPPFLPKYSRAQRSPAVIKSGTIYYPIWLGYATGLLEQAGHECRLIDAPARGYDFDQVMGFARELQPDLICVDTSTPSIFSDVRSAEQLKNAFPSSFVCLTGTHVSALPEESLQLSLKVDGCTRKEYDHTLRHLVELLSQGVRPGDAELSAVQGLSFRERSGGDSRIVHNLDRPWIRNIDELPFVSEVWKRHLVIEDYFYSITPHPVVTIITGRGCPFKCTYCLYPQTMHGHGYRFRSVDNVADEMKYVETTWPHAKQIFIEDDTLTVNRKRCVDLSEALLKRKVKIGWTCNSRADVDYETLKAMRKANCRLLCVGFESADQRILDNIEKRITTDQFRQFTTDAKKAGVLVHGCFMFGNPGETPESMRATLELAKDMSPDTAQFFPLMVYPGTKAYDWAKENDYLATTNFREWVDGQGHHNSIISRPGLTGDDLVEFANQARREYYARPKYIASKIKQSLTDPHEGKRVMMAFKTFLPTLLKRRRTKKAAGAGTL